MSKKNNEPTLTQVGVAFVIVLFTYWVGWQVLDAIFFDIIAPWASAYKWVLSIVQVIYVLLICCGVPVAVSAIKILAMKMAKAENENS